MGLYDPLESPVRLASSLSDNVHYPARRKIADAALPTFSAGLDVPELVTPTGACLVAELATERAVAWPGDGFVPERVGYGAGGRDLADRANVFMAVLGRREPGREPRASSSSSEAGGAHSIGHYTHALGPDAEANGGGHSHGHDHNHSH